MLWIVRSWYPYNTVPLWSTVIVFFSKLWSIHTRAAQPSSSCVCKVIYETWYCNERFPVALLPTAPISWQTNICVYHESQNRTTFELTPLALGYVFGSGRALKYSQIKQPSRINYHSFLSQHAWVPVRVPDFQQASEGQNGGACRACGRTVDGRTSTLNICFWAIVFWFFLSKVCLLVGSFETYWKNGPWSTEWWWDHS